MTAHPIQAIHLDNDPADMSDVSILKARIATLIAGGKSAMSPRDLKSGYEPADVIRAMRVAILFIYKGVYEQGGTEWRDPLGTWRPIYLLRDEITNLEKLIQLNPNVMTEEQTKETEQTAALKTLQLAVQIRQARQTIESQIKDMKQQAKSKVSALRKAEAALLDSDDGDQMKLFELPPELPESIQKIIDDPEI